MPPLLAQLLYKWIPTVFCTWVPIVPCTILHLHLWWWCRTVVQRFAGILVATDSARILFRGKIEMFGGTCAMIQIHLSCLGSQIAQRVCFCYVPAQPYLFLRSFLRGQQEGHLLLCYIYELGSTSICSVMCMDMHIWMWPVSHMGSGCWHKEQASNNLILSLVFSTICQLVSQLQQVHLLVISHYLLAASMWLLSQSTSHLSYPAFVVRLPPIGEVALLRFRVIQINDHLHAQPYSFSLQIVPRVLHSMTRRWNFSSVVRI